MSAIVTPEELLRQIRKWLIMPSSDGVERTAWPEMVAQIDITLRDSTDAATRMRDRCVDAIKSLRAVPRGAAYNNAINDAIHKVEVLTLEGEQEKRK